MRGTAMTLRSPTASTEETVTSYMVLTSCPASKFISQSVPRPLSHHCVAPSVSPPSLCPSLFLSVYLWCHCCWSPCLPFLGYDRSTCTPAAHLQPTCSPPDRSAVSEGFLSSLFTNLLQKHATDLHLHINVPIHLMLLSPRWIHFRARSVCEMGRKAEVLNKTSPNV